MKKIDNLIDCVIFGWENRELKVLLIKRKNEPQKGVMALPGDFVEENESIDNCAKRTLKMITDLDSIYLEQIRAFGSVDRFPLKRVITIGYYALINVEHYSPQAGYTAEKLEWHSISKLPELAFDHKEIVLTGYEILKRKVRNQPIGFNLLPDKFSLTELQHLYEAILQTELNKRNFRTKLNQMKLLVNTGIKQEKVAHKPALLYRFDNEVYAKLTKEGFHFKL